MQELTVSQQELAEWLDLSARRIRELTTSGVLSKGPAGYEVRASVKAYLTFLRSTLGSLTDERARLTRALASMAELKLRQRAGELVLKEAVEKKWFELARVVRDGFNNLPARSAGLVASERNQERCHQILAEEVRQILEGLSRGSGNGTEVRPASPSKERSPTNKA